MKIYFAASIRGGRADREIYSSIILELQKYGKVLTEHIGDPNISSSGEEIPDTEIYNRDMAWLREADVVIGEITTPSLGVGYEIGQAESMGKKIFCLYREIDGKKVSAMITGSSGVKVSKYMLFSINEDIKDIIIKELLNKEETVENIHKILTIKYKEKITIFGIYKILDKLKKEEVVTKAEKKYIVSEQWRLKVIEKLSKKDNDFIKLEEGEKLDFKFNSLANLDHYWKNIAISIDRENIDHPVFFLSAHPIWMFIDESRKNSEKEYYESFNERKINLYQSIQNDEFFDKEFKKEFSSEYIKINTGEKTDNRNTNHIAIFGDYITTTVLSKKIADEIDNLYKEEKDLNIFKEKFLKIEIENKNARLIVERNKNKAKMLRKKLSKNFYIPKELIEKYDLF
jgi:nucleoside 2-deoxyribosyltransferase